MNIVKRSGILFALSILATPLFASTMVFPDYVDNSDCLMKPYLGCPLDKGKASSTELSWTIPIVGRFASFDKTGGKIFLYWPQESFYSKLFLAGTGTVPGYPRWTPKGGYMFNIGDAERVPITAEMYLREKKGDSQALPIPVTCGGKLGLGTNFYRAHMTKTSGLVCSIPRGKWPHSIKLLSGLGGNVPIYFRMKDPAPRERNIQIPAIMIALQGEGYDTEDMLGEPSGAYTYAGEQTTQVMEAGLIALNDRLCKISSPNTQIDFGNVSTTAPAGKIAERVMPLTVTCAGVPQMQGCSNCRPKDAWKGVDNNLVGININTRLTYPGENAAKKIGLAPANMKPEEQARNVRNDLFVEGSWLRSERCGVAPLWTNGTKNDIKEINVPAAESASASLPTLYWRLCAKPNDGLVKAGQFNGQATISIEYN